MLLWFAGGALVIVWQVFRDPAIDYRLAVAGALAPDLVDAALGAPHVGHTLLAAGGLLVAVMVGTRGRRGTRRRLLAVPIGVFLHLVLDGMWARTSVFWWPAFGPSFPGGGLPSLSRPAVVVALQEVVGLAAVVWWWRRFRLTEPERLRAFARTGRVGRDLAC